MSQVDWLAMVRSESSLDESASLFLSSLAYLYNVAFPVRSVRIRRTDPPWLTPQLRLLMNDRDVAWRKGDVKRFQRLRKEIS